MRTTPATRIVSRFATLAANAGSAPSVREQFGAMSTPHPADPIGTVISFAMMPNGTVRCWADGDQHQIHELPERAAEVARRLLDRDRQLIGAQQR